jgi:GT2 family glycosyltransferase
MPAELRILQGQEDINAAPARPTVSVIVPVYKGGAAFAHCLEALLAARPAPLEILVVDDGSDDGSDRRALRPGVTLLHSGGRRGPAAARNLGAWAARGDLLFFVDADVTVPPGALGQFIPLFQQDASVAAVIGSYDDQPPCPNLLSQYKNLLHHRVHQLTNEEGFTFWGACGVVRREVFLQAGGFDEGYRRPSIEDIELGYRLKAAGHSIRVHKSLQVKHWKTWTAGLLFRTDFFQRALPWTALILQAGRMPNDLNLGHPARARVALACLLPVLAAAGLLWPAALGLAALAALALLALDAPVFNFFRQKRGLWFAARALPWHWFSHLFSGVAFATGVALHLLRRPARAPRPAPLAGVLPPRITP